MRDIYRHEAEVFQSRGWCAFYPAMLIGYMITPAIAVIYVSFPIYPHLNPMSDGALSSEAPLA